MSRFIDHRDMAADDLFNCAKDAKAILYICSQAAWDIQNCEKEQRINELADAIEQLTSLANEMLDPVYDALQSHEGVKGDMGSAS